METKAINKKKKGSVHAPGQYLGYSLQATRFLARLLEEEDSSIISLEVFEDVGVEKANGNKIAEQDKSSIEGNPVSDLNVSLWKTFANWIDSILIGELILEKTFFEIYVSRPVTGNIINSFSDAKTIESSTAAFIKAKNTFYEKNDKLKVGINKELLPYITKIFSLEKTLISGLITRFSLQNSIVSPLEDLRAKLSKTYPRDLIENILTHSLGWIKVRIDKLIENKKPAYIAVNEFRNDLFSHIRMIDRRTILHSFAPEPTKSKITSELLIRTYVKQLDLIGCSDEDKIQAVIDYLKSSIDRTNWSYDGYINEKSFDLFSENLLRKWNNLKKKIDIAYSSLEETKKGQLLMIDCSIQKENLQGLEVPPHFISGSYHSLADDKVIGWHPSYKKLLNSN